MPPAVTSENLTVHRGSHPALRNISFSIPCGSITGLLGPSGSGKTTLIRAVVGVQIVTSGAITVLGHRAGSRELRGTVRYVTQNASIYDDLTITENVTYFATLYGLGDRDVRHAIKSVHLDGIPKNRLVRDLSGGQRTRVTLACALVGTPTLLVLDEPTVGLDPVLREDLWRLFHHLAENGTTILISSHVMDEARRCNHILFLRDGHLIADDTPTRIKDTTGHDDLEDAFLALANRIESEELS
ncbi:ABC transporter ATP-binding protein [Hoyosella rhizosphaerae]|uniref:Multidrug ABC transporter ATP-binding protein n=1 Tax=Hoyosella rhizosphaerae TaxID=1755582 RepID=A0A916UE59_9ACTN|nr:ABC transporter ATP-binding protein [Hoyosella rhizosphaerae]MBN4925822.1 ABC transporter ATP-binding protein [Hoyosella rhizosphaerae]GGC67683.1 multidrug ABC transporter ATP-binding protein [Hoyosella rhizosphaerae]